VLAGLAMQRVLVTATAIGLSTSLLSQPLEVPVIRSAMRTLLGVHGSPQTVLRIGHARPAAAPSPRRPAEAVAGCGPVP
jgi:isopentenyl diphosphate isomerase/L-lactate dehydrogenase-like FMN-dependent dehydrogenase